MRTFLMLVLLSMCQLSTAYANVEPKIKFVQDSTGTWRKLEVLKDTKIEQPSGLDFSEEQLDLMYQGKMVSLLDTLEKGRARFNLRTENLFYINYTMKRSYYRLVGNEIVFKGKADIVFPYPDIQTLLINLFFFLIFFLMLAVVNHRSIESLIATGAAILIGIEATFYLGFTGIFIGAILSALASQWNKLSDSFDSSMVQVGENTEATGAVFGGIRGMFLSATPMFVAHDESTGQIALTIVAMMLVMVLWGALVVQKVWQDKPSKKSTSLATIPT